MFGLSPVLLDDVGHSQRFSSQVVSRAPEVRVERPDYRLVVNAYSHPFAPDAFRSDEV